METNNKVYAKLDRYEQDSLAEESDRVTYNHQWGNFPHDREGQPHSLQTTEETLKVYDYDLTLSESMRDEDLSIKKKRDETMTTSKDTSVVVVDRRRTRYPRKVVPPRSENEAASSTESLTGFQKELQMAHLHFVTKKMGSQLSVDGGEEKKEDGGQASNATRSRLYGADRSKLSPSPTASPLFASSMPMQPSLPRSAEFRDHPDADTNVYSDDSMTRQLRIELEKTCRMLDLERLKNLAMRSKMESVEGQLQDLQESKSNQMLEQYTRQVRQLHEEVSRHRELLESEKSKRRQLQGELDAAKKNVQRTEEQLSVLVFQHLPSVAPRFKDIGSVDYQIRESFGYVGPYQIGKMLGEGHYGSVRVGTNVDSGKKFAIKMLDKERITRFKDLQQVAIEVHVLNKYRHPNIVELEEVIHAPDNIYVVTALCSIDLHKFHNDIGLTEGSAKEVTLGLLRPLQFLHAHGICHLDVKPENILLTHTLDAHSLSHTHVRLCDFGLGNMARKPDQSKDIIRSGYACGTPGFFAPEMMSNKFEGRIADMWSVGCVILEVTLGLTKDWIEYYEGADSDPDAFRRGLESSLRELSNEQYPLHGMLLDMIHSCLSIDTSTRITAGRALSHHWLSDVYSDPTNHRTRADDLTQRGDTNGGLLSRLYKERESLVSGPVPRFCT